ncbi:MAG TPA: 5-formyltetrahydrofolate cyclo-ligase [Paenibacillus sp.]|jgi:5-formyltetrahydrofolate cyclo-ligase
MNGDNRELSDIKKDLRIYMSSMRNALYEREREIWSSESCHHASVYLNKRGIRCFLAYIPFRSELSTVSLIEWGWQQQLQVLAPRCYQEDCSMTLHTLGNWRELSPGAYGIPEPDVAQTVSLAHDFVPEAIILPGLAFDREGGRLGYGSGYYDRLYERLQHVDISRPAPLLIGIGFEMQVLSKVPMDGHDVALDVLITENGIVNCKGEAT